MKKEIDKVGFKDTRKGLMWQHACIANPLPSLIDMFTLRQHVNVFLAADLLIHLNACFSSFFNVRVSSALYNCFCVEKTRLAIIFMLS